MYTYSDVIKNYSIAKHINVSSEINKYPGIIDPIVSMLLNHINKQ